MFHATITPRLRCSRGFWEIEGRAYVSGEERLQPRSNHRSTAPETSWKHPVPRLDLLVVLVLALVCGAVTSAVTGDFQPLPLLGGVIIAGVVRSLRLSRQRG
jgi:hypothetical protein